MGDGFALVRLSKVRGREYIVRPLEGASSVISKAPEAGVMINGVYISWRSLREFEENGLEEMEIDPWEGFEADDGEAPDVPSE